MNGIFMDANQIEEMLRKAPSPKAPADLLRKLTADIRAPRAAAVGEASHWRRPPSWTRRWLPALSFATIFLVCVAVIAVQTNIVSELQRQNGDLRAATANLDGLRAENQEYQKLRHSSDELDQLRKENAELLKLRAEVAQLQAQLQDAGKVRAENQQLLVRVKAAAPAGTNSDFFGEAQARAERIQCVNNLKQIGLAGRLWAQDNNDVYPSNFICMTNELSTWKILQCPADKSHIVTNWAEVAAGRISYIMDAPGMMLNGGPGYLPNIIFVECPIHHNVCMVDGSVRQLNEQNCEVGPISPDGSQKIYSRIKMVNGRKVLSQ